MGVFTGPKMDDIIALLRKQQIDGQDTFVMARRHNSALKGLLKLLASNLYYAMDSTTLRILVANAEEFVVINPNRQFTRSYADLPADRITRIPWDQIQQVSVDQKSRTATISWTTTDGASQQWDVDTANPGVWHFNPEHLKQFIATCKNEGKLG